MAFATLDEAWGVAGLAAADRVSRNRPKTRDKKGSRGERKVRVLENIMDVYTADKRSEVTPDCHMAPYPSAHDVLPGFTADFADVPFDEDDTTTLLDEEDKQQVPARRESTSPKPKVTAIERFEAPSSSSERFEPPSRSPSPSSSSLTQGIDSTVSSSSVVSAFNGRDTFFLEMFMYVVSGILLIFMMEQFVRLGSNLRARA